MNGDNGRPKQPHVIGMRHANGPPDLLTAVLIAMVAAIICLSCTGLAAAIATVITGGH